MEKIIQKYQPVIGEFVWHSLTSDPNIMRDSDIHYDRICSCIKKWAKTPVKTILEVASYAHVTGYKLQHELNADVTLFDLSASTLKLGKKTAEKCGFLETPELVAGDFHSLPFEDCSFDLVFISSAIHHTEDYSVVVREMQRILAPNGLLIILNEPYEREACFYKFRCNRSNAYTLFEEKLAELGLLCTIAEPHPGSRDEALFGMVENQQIPLGDFLSILSDECALAEIKTTYETRIGAIERQWVRWADDQKVSTALLQQRIVENLNININSAEKSLDAVAKGLEFSVPDTEEINEMGRHIALKLRSRPEDKRCLAYNKHLSELFGGSLFVVGHKKASLRHRADGDVHRSLDTYPIIDGVRMCFADEIVDFLNHENSLVPVLNIKHLEKINNIFPANDWIVMKEDNGFHTLTPTSSVAEIILPPSPSNYLIFLRINFSLPDENCFYRFEIFDNSKLIYDYNVFREDAILYRCVVPSLEKSQCVLSCKVVPADQNHSNPITLPQAVKIYYAGLFPL